MSKPPKSWPRKARKYWPAGVHPLTKDPFVDGTIEMERGYQEIELMPPAPPTSQEAIYDDEGELTGYRKLSAKEFRVEMSEYKRLLEKWRKTGGLLRIVGVVTVSGRFRTGAGAVVSGRFLDGQWFWSSMSTC